MDLKGIDSFKYMLLPEYGDSQEKLSFKAAFQELSILFVREFSREWINNGKVGYKDAHI